MLGNPTAYEIIMMLIRRSLKPSQIASELKLSIPTVSAVLRSLRQLDLVRYETEERGKKYFIKDPQLKVVMRNIANLVNSIEKGDY